MRTRRQTRRTARALCTIGIGLSALAVVAGPHAAWGQGSAPATPLHLLARETRRTVPTAVINGHEYIGLDELSPPFQLSVREEAGSLTVTSGGRTIVLTPDQPLASVGGRLVSLPAPPVRSGRRWLVPLEFVSRALGPAAATPVDLRKASRLLIIGELRVPRVVVRQEGSATQARVTIDSVPAAGTTLAQEPGRLVVRLDADAIDPTLPPPATTPLVTRIEQVAGQPAIAIDTGPAYASHRSSSSTAGGSSRTTIDLFAQGAAATPAPAAPTAPPPAPPPELAPVPGGLRAVAIDPGHGGEDHGVRGAGGTVEKEVTLDLARRLKTALETRLGLRVVLTRDDDRALGLDERAAIANNSRADLFVSLHANGALRAGARGAEVTYLSADAGGGDGALVADSPPVPGLGGASRPLELIRWDRAQARHLERSALFASGLADTLRQQMAEGSATVRQRPMRVLVGANMPAVLFEVGYLSNPEEERRLSSDEYRTRIVQAVVDAIVRFRDRVSVAPGLPRSPVATPAGEPAPATGSETVQ